MVLSGLNALLLVFSVSCPSRTCNMSSLLFPGKYDEIAALLGEGFANDEALHKLMGDNRSEYERKLQERLARRQKRMADGKQM